MPTRTIEEADIRLPAILLGVGLGGFVDGILLHQVLQWHHMLSATGTDNVGIREYPVDTVPGLRMNTLWDGLFHVVTWVSVLAGLALLHARVTRSRSRLWRSRTLWGWALVGWGLFNLVEGIIDHHLLGIHHVREGENRLWWDLAFLALGVLLVAAGWLLQRSDAGPRTGADAGADHAVPAGHRTHDGGTGDLPPGGESPRRDGPPGGRR